MSMYFRDPEEPLLEEQKLLRKKVLHQITEEPESFDMSAFESFEGREITPPENAVCGTTRCIAGWALFFNGNKGISNMGAPDICQEAIDIMGLSCTEYRDGGDLFYLGGEDYAIERLSKLIEDQEDR